MDSLSIAVLMLPLAGAATTHFTKGRVGWCGAKASVIGSAATFAVAALLLGLAVFDRPSSVTLLGSHWGMLLFDPLSSLMAFVVSGISLIVHLYSVRYMAEEAGYARFFVLLDLMTAALLLMVSAGDLITLLIAWHLIGVLLYFLLSHDTTSQSAHRYATWTLITYRIGDLPLLAAAGLLYHATGSWALQDVFTQLASRPDAETLLGLPLTETVAALIALAAFARSAQFMLHVWLPYTMSGPTPVSALMHAGIVNAGGFLINRFAPLFAMTQEVLHWVFLMGLITAVIGSVLMLAQNDIKKSLGYSTMGQMGFMIMECGVGAFSLAIYHLIAHGLFKGTLFLGAGGVISDARRDDGVPKDELYTFVIERRPARRRQPWLLMAALTLVVPVVILVLAHWLVEQDVLQEQGAVVLLFFGWVTGAQLIFSTYRMRTQNIWRLMGLILFSFTVVVIGYTLISHGFDLFLYPDPSIRSSIYGAADISVVWFDALVILLTAVVVLGWLATYYAEQNGRRWTGGLTALWRGFYRLIAGELFVMRLYSALSAAVLRLAVRLNVLLRWA